MTDPVKQAAEQAAESVASAVVQERRSVVSKVLGYVKSNPKTVLAILAAVAVAGYVYGLLS